MQSVSDDDVWKRLLEKPVFELAVKGVCKLGRCYIFWQGIPGLWASNRKITATDCLTGGIRRRLVPVEQSVHLAQVIQGMAVHFHEELYLRK